MSKHRESRGDEKKVRFPVKLRRGDRKALEVLNDNLRQIHKRMDDRDAFSEDWEIMNGQ
jgi:hypothetical protein